jgi:hypothetical protein
MEQRISLITLGVSDLQRAVTFYERVLGWKAAPSPPEIAFFDLNGVVFSLYPHDELAKDMQSVSGDASSYQGVALAHNVRSKEEVNAIFALLKQHRATIVKEPQEAFWGGYSGYFADPDGHKWEVAFNPYWTIQKDGRISMTGQA